MMPVIVQNMCITIFGIKWYRRRFKGDFDSELQGFIRRENFVKKEWDDYKKSQLQKLILHAYRNVPYYKKLFDENNISASNFDLSDLPKIPLLNKETFKAIGQDTLIAKKAEYGGEFYSSSGSTGTPTKVLVSRKCHQRYAAANEARSRMWAGVTRRSPRGMIGGRRVIVNSNDGPPFHRYNLVERQVYFSAYHISNKNAKYYVEAMWRYKIEYMTGYAVSNYLLATFIKQNDLKVPKLKAVITSSEKLTEDMRTLMEEVYRCKVFDGWSGVEACAMISECEHGSLHVSEDVGLIEVIDENGEEVGEGESGEVVCTGFLNYDQPLIRYRIGDRVTKGVGSCKCGRHMPIIKDIDGRVEDIVTGRDGRKMVRFHSVFVGLSSIHRAQVIQRSLEHLQIKIENDNELNQEEIDLITNRIKSQLGDVNIEIKQHCKIDLINGKFKAVISNLK